MYCYIGMEGGYQLRKDINVQPLRTRAEIEDMKDALRLTGGERDRFLFILGINTGLRVSDLLKLKVGDVLKPEVTVTEQKTGKRRRINLSGLSEEIERYTLGKKPDDYLFASRKRTPEGETRPITPTQAYRSLQKAANLLERDDIGTHTMRKTFGYHHYKRNKDVAILMELFNHASPAITKRYIGIRQDEIDESLKGFSL